MATPRGYSKGTTQRWLTEGGFDRMMTQDSYSEMATTMWPPQDGYSKVVLRRYLISLSLKIHKVWSPFGRVIGI